MIHFIKIFQLFSIMYLFPVLHIASFYVCVCILLLLQLFGDSNAGFVHPNTNLQITGEENPSQLELYIEELADNK